MNSWFCECEAFNLPANCASDHKNIPRCARQVDPDNYFLVRLKYNLKMPRRREIILLQVLCVFARVSSINISITQCTQFFWPSEAITLTAPAGKFFIKHSQRCASKWRSFIRTCEVLERYANHFIALAALAVVEYIALHLRLFSLSACTLEARDEARRWN